MLDGEVREEFKITHLIKNYTRMSKKKQDDPQVEGIHKVNGKFKTHLGVQVGSISVTAFEGRDF
jgi:hypothetical protein